MNEHEAAARSRKAYRISRVCETIMAEHPEITVAHFREAEPDLRARIAVLAKVNVPSETTWELMLEMLEARE